jgi:high-affinity iron transporter
LFNASILILAVMMLTWHNVWMASHGREMARELKAAGREVVTGKRTLAALGVVVGVAVLREGSEVVLFLYGIAAQGGVSNAGLLTGGALGLAAGASVSALMYLGLLTIPAGRLFQVTSGLITLLAAGMAAQAVLFLQNGGYINGWSGTIWDTSWLLKEDSIPGRLLHTLVGYVQAPDGAQIAAYLAAIAGILLLMRMTGRPQPARRPQPAE